MTRPPDHHGDLAAIGRGGRRAFADILSAIESDPLSVDALLDQAWNAPAGHIIGLTGPPGVGKSTLIGALLPPFCQRKNQPVNRPVSGRENPHRVAVIAVDPSSRQSGGALLGDRIRFDAAVHDGVFIRSMAARDALGGMAAATLPAAIFLAAFYDRVVIETVGVGQSETDIGNLADTVVLCAQPGGGDSLQFMKSGIAEIPDIIAVTKADAPSRKNGDKGEAATDIQTDPVLAATLSEVKLALALRLDRADIPVLPVSSKTSTGIRDLVTAMDHHRAALAQKDQDQNRDQSQDHNPGHYRGHRHRKALRRWADARVVEHIGRRGRDRHADDLDRLFYPCAQGDTYPGGKNPQAKYLEDGRLEGGHPGGSHSKDKNLEGGRPGDGEPMGNERPFSTLAAIISGKQE